MSRKRSRRKFKNLERHNVYKQWIAIGRAKMVTVVKPTEIFLISTAETSFLLGHIHSKNARLVYAAK